jgi:pimeloyl-ACP methyl ester carboxylesterase
MPYITVNDHSLHYADTPASSGSPKAIIVFIHGLGSTQNYFFPILPYLSEYRCITFDTYGAGRSKLDYPVGEHSIETIAVDVLSILDRLCGKDSKAIVVGYSMGGMVPTHLAATAPARVLAAICIGPVHPTPTVADIFKQRVPKVREEGMDAMANTIPYAATGPKTTPTMQAFIREMLLSQSIEGYALNCKAIEEATPPEYGKVTCPVYIIAGSEDKSAPVKGCELIMNEIATDEKSLKILEGIGHWHCVEASEKVGGLLKSFCDRAAG